jgi:hypothetical protein
MPTDNKTEVTKISEKQLRSETYQRIAQLGPSYAMAALPLLPKRDHHKTICFVTQGYIQAERLGCAVDMLPHLPARIQVQTRRDLVIAYVAQQRFSDAQDLCDGFQDKERLEMLSLILNRYLDTPVYVVSFLKELLALMGREFDNELLDRAFTGLRDKTGVEYRHMQEVIGLFPLEQRSALWEQVCAIYVDSGRYDDAVQAAQALERELTDTELQKLHEEIVKNNSSPADLQRVVTHRKMSLTAAELSQMFETLLRQKSYMEYIRLLAEMPRPKQKQKALDLIQHILDHNIDKNRAAEYVDKIPGHLKPACWKLYLHACIESGESLETTSRAARGLGRNLTLLELVRLSKAWADLDAARPQMSVADRILGTLKVPPRTVSATT